MEILQTETSRTTKTETQQTVISKYRYKVAWWKDKPRGKTSPHDSR